MNTPSLKSPDVYASAAQLAELKALTCEELVADLDREIILAKIRHEASVANATTPDGKPTYSNSEKRKAATEALIAADDQIITWTKESREAAHDAAIAKIDARFQARLFEVALAYLKK